MKKEKKKIQKHNGSEIKNKTVEKEILVKKEKKKNYTNIKTINEVKKTKQRAICMT